MPSSTSRFERADSKEGFLSAQRASTDALNALGAWRNERGGRGFDVLQDEAEFIVARLIWGDDDASVGDSLNGICAKYGVRRTPT